MVGITIVTLMFHSHASAYMYSVHVHVHVCIISMFPVNKSLLDFDFKCLLIL